MTDSIHSNPLDMDWLTNGAMQTELINLLYLFNQAGEIWDNESQSGGDAESATKIMVESIKDDLADYLGDWDWEEDGAVAERLIGMLAAEIVEVHINNFVDYEEQDCGETALQEAERDIRNETMKGLR